MAEVRGGPLQEVVGVVRSIVAEWDAFVRQVETLTREHEQLRGRCEWQEKQLRDLQEAQERLRREHAEATQALTELRAAHQALLHEHEESTRSHHDLRARHEALERSRLDAAEELESLLRRLKP